MKQLKHIIWIFTLLTISIVDAKSQCVNNINHWEACVLDNHVWRYIVPTANMPGWTATNFNDGAWAQGNGGMGYGDNDDNTILPNGTRSVYMRKSFNIVDTSAIGSVVFCMDYDDGFVAYLNGVEIARANLNGNPPNYNNLTPTDHEAQLYQNKQPDYFILTQQQISSLLVNGNNVLAVETHNVTANSNDLTSRPFLMLGLKNAAQNYFPTPAWFNPPTPLYTNLPIIVINTLGQTIKDDPRIVCDMGIIDNGPGNMNCVYDPYNNYNGKVSIEIRGSSSQSVPKKGYGFSTLDALGVNQVNVSILGMPKENDWVLNATYTDKTFQRDVLIYDLARYMGWYTTRVRYCEVVINGDYKGIYILQEKVKQDKNRVDVEKLTNTMNSGDSLTGGYVYKIDWETGAPGGAWNTPQGVQVKYHDPKYAKLTNTQRTYLKNWVNGAENDLFSANFQDPETGYRKKTNAYSFADDFILQEFSNNIDAYRASNYFHKDRDSKCGKHTIAPFWDFNFTFGSPNWCFGQNTQGWQLTGGCGTQTSKWMNKLLQDSWFKNIISCRWSNLRSDYLTNANIFHRLDSIATYIQSAAQRDSARWGLVYWPTNWTPSNLNVAMDSMKSWMVLRLQWMDANMYSPTMPCNGLNNMSLVIDEINFHSDSSINSGDWLELYNYGASAIDISHATIFDGDGYERYCILPANTIIPAGGRLVVYQDSAAFASQYPNVLNKVGPLCFKLSNGGQKIIIRDKDNQLIYSVQYSDLWQCVTDGHGRTLQLTNPNANPNIGDSWFAGCVGGSPGVAYTPCNENLILSEINYNSSVNADAGDWIEFHNKQAVPVSLAGWSIRDGSNHVYYFPPNTNIVPNGYLVAYSDQTKFTTQFPTLNNIVGPIGFGFSSNGDVAKVYDNTGKLQFSICYKTTAPWPTTPNGGGFTLENGAYNGNQNASTTWFAGCKGGSPGVVYTPCVPAATDDLTKEDYITLYPNPAHNELNLESNLTLSSVKIYDNLGRLIIYSEVKNNKIDISSLAEGMYQLHCKTDKGAIFNVKFVKLQ